MKKLTIYNVYVEMQDQAQCDRMKQLCADNGLDIWGCCFNKHETDKSIFFYDGDFWITDVKSSIEEITIESQKVTEKEFIELLKNK